MFDRSARTTTTARPAALAFGILLSLAVAAPAQDLAAFEKRTTVHRLANGWTFLIVERPVAPVFSFATVADVGSAQEVIGITGLAHMFEHMAFKGTRNFGTTDWAAEEKALDAVEVAYAAYDKARRKPKPNGAEVERLAAELAARQEEAGRFIEKGAFDGILQREGGVGLNAATGADATRYFYSLPSNKFELFAYLESERFFEPVFREFYQERAVVQDERRYAIESQPIGRLVEQVLGAAFNAHPYGQPTIGWMSDLDSYTRADAEAFFRRYYAPSNLTTAIVGDVDPKVVIPILEKYFGRIPARPHPEPLRTVEPPQEAEKRVTLFADSEPFYLEVYHKPATTDPTQPIFDAIDDLLSNGRTSRLYRALVRDQRIAISVDSFSGYPGEKYPHLWGVFIVPAPGVPLAKIEAAVAAEIDKLRTTDVGADELVRAKRRARADLLRTLNSNQGLATQLSDYHRLYGDWRELFRYLERLDQVTAQDIRRVAGATFVVGNRTIGTVDREPSPAPVPASALEKSTPPPTSAQPGGVR